MKNMNRMKACVRPAMCKPYGKQSESLQKSKVKYINCVVIHVIMSNLSGIIYLFFNYELNSRS